jgi:Arc/MetJ family transcription regulator
VVHEACKPGERPRRVVNVVNCRGIAGCAGGKTAAAGGHGAEPPWPDVLRKLRRVIFKRVGEGRPYPDHALTPRQWAAVPPRQLRLDQLITTKRTLDLETLLAEDSTFYGDLFAHVVQWRGELYLEDGLHRALRAALQQRPVIHARILVLDDSD